PSPADCAGAAPRRAPGPALRCVLRDGAVADGDGADEVDDPAAVASAAGAAIAAAAARPAVAAEGPVADELAVVDLGRGRHKRGDEGSGGDGAAKAEGGGAAVAAASPLAAVSTVGLVVGEPAG